MEIYRHFSEVYDALTQDVDYDQMVAYIESLFEAHMAYKPHLVLELACGTGNITRRLSNKKYDMIALDASLDMLNVAREKCEADVLLLQQDMTDFELYGTVDAIVCLLDSVNYITEPEKLQKMFDLAENYLEYGGLLVFDINSPYKLRNIIGENTFVRETDTVFSVWENEQDAPFVHFYLNFFCKNDGQQYTRFYEQHTERIYEVPEIISMLEKSGFCDIHCYGKGTFTFPGKNEERIFFTANKRQKPGNK